MGLVIPTNYYQHHDADRSLTVPAEGFGGWKKANLEINPSRTAVVVMHAWDCGTWEEYPGWHRVVEYIPRAYDICQTVFPRLLSAVRDSELKLFHVVAPHHHYYQDYTGYQRAMRLTDSVDAIEPNKRIESDPIRDRLYQFKAENANPGTHNKEDIRRGAEQVNFAKEAVPLGDEGIAATSEQLFALCQAEQVNHLIYVGFAINGCLLLSPGGMVDMQRKGVMCSTIRQAVTAIENKETARQELGKENALWYVALLFGFVYDVDDFVEAIQ